MNNCRRSGWAQTLSMKNAARMLTGIRFRQGHPKGVGHTDLCKSGGAQDAAVTSSARSPGRVGVVTTVCQAVIEAQVETFADDVGLRQLQQRCMDPKFRPLHTFC